MAQSITLLEGPEYSGLNGATAILRGQRVKLAADGTLALCGLTEMGIGTARQPIAIGARGLIRLWNAPGEMEFVANAAVAFGDLIYTAATGKGGASASTGLFIGICTYAAAADLGLSKLIRTPLPPAVA